MSDTANETRGEISLALEGVDYVLRPSYEALVAIEKQAGRSLQQLAQAAGDGAMTVEQAAIVVTECIRAQGKATGNPSLQAFNTHTVGEELVNAGILHATLRLEILLYLAVTGGYSAQGERKALATKTATPADA